MPQSSASAHTFRNAHAPALAPTDIVIPDCCNIGVVFRILMSVNAAALTGILLRSTHWKLGVIEFVEASMLIELACLWSLLGLCVLRRVILRLSTRSTGRVWLLGQRLACALVPASVTGVIVHLFTSIDWLADGFTDGAMMKAVLVAGLFGALFQHYFELRTRAYSPALMEARLQALQARIRPHFLFNSLNAVLSLIRSEPRQAENTLEDLADLFRILMSDPRSMTTLEEEIRLCKQYLSIEKIRLGERLQLLWQTENVDEDMLRKAQVPVLLLQPLLENAVHYGVEPAAEPVSIQVHLSRSMDRIQIVVVNPYHEGMMTTEGNHIALANIRERLALLYDVEAQLTTTIARGNFEARLRFPYTRGAA